MSLTLPPLVHIIFYIIACLSGMITAWYLGKRTIPFIQKFQEVLSQKDIADAKKVMTESDTKFNSESDDLKKIDQR